MILLFSFIYGHISLKSSNTTSNSPRARGVYKRRGGSLTTPATLTDEKGCCCGLRVSQFSTAARVLPWLYSALVQPKFAVLYCTSHGRLLPGATQTQSHGARSGMAAKSARKGRHVDCVIKANRKFREQSNATWRSTTRSWAPKGIAGPDVVVYSRRLSPLAVRVVHRFLALDSSQNQSDLKNNRNPTVLQVNPS